MLYITVGLPLSRHHAIIVLREHYAKPASVFYKVRIIIIVIFIIIIIISSSSSSSSSSSIIRDFDEEIHMASREEFDLTSPMGTCQKTCIGLCDCGLHPAVLGRGPVDDAGLWVQERSLGGSVDVRRVF